MGMIATGTLLVLLLLRRLVQPQLPQVFDRAGLWTVATLLFVGGIILMSNGRGLFGLIGGLAQWGSLILATYTILQYQPAFVNILYAHMQPQPALPVKAIHQQLAETNVPGDAIRTISIFTQAYLHIDGLQLLRPSLAESASAKGMDVEATPISFSIDSPIWLAFMQQQAIRQYDLRYHAAFTDAPPREREALLATMMRVFVPLLIDGRCAVIFAFDKKQNGLPYTFAEINILRACIDQLGTALTARPMQQTILSLDQSLLRAKGEIKKLEAIKSDFITIASHELRTPLAQMRGYVDIVESIASDPGVDAAQRDKIFSNLRKSANRLEEIVSAMLDASQLEVGEMDFKFVSAKPETLIKLVTDPLKDPIAERNLTLTINDMSDLPPIRADMPRLVQAIRNVLINAIRYTPDEGHISVSAVVADDARDFVRFAIADTGIGIEPAQTTLIFEKFYRGFDTQLHSTGAYKFMGAGPGLGLTIANGIIKAHGGKIVASSAGRDIEKHLGSTFYIDLPIEEESSAETVGTRPSEMQP
jgi:signal transduction histidine kinase